MKAIDPTKTKTFTGGIIRELYIMTASVFCFVPRFELHFGPYKKPLQCKDFNMVSGF